MSNVAQQLAALQHAAGDVLPIDPNGVVTQSVPCLECGHIVRGMSIDQLCPECATPITRSMRGLLLRCADRTWLGMVRAGLTLLVAFVVFNALMPADLIAQPFQHVPFIALATWFGMSIITAMFVLGAWMVTTAEPTRMLSKREDVLRTAIRVAAAIAAALLVAHDAVVTRAGMIIEVPLIAGVGLTMLILVIMVGMYMRGLVDRIPDSELRRALEVTMIGLVICLGSYTIAVLWMARSGTAVAQLRPVNILTLIQQPYGHSAFGAVMWLIAIAAVVSTLGAVAVAIGFRGAIREIIWSAPSGLAVKYPGEDAADGPRSERTPSA